MSDLILHPEKGVNPRLTFCMQCGGDGEDLIMLGANESKYTCPECGCVHYGRPDKRQCGQCGQHFHRDNWRREKIGEYEKLPASRPCALCREKNEECAKVVAEGGIHWRCKDCGSAGAIRAASELAIDIRKQMGIEAPAPCGVEFDKKSCPACSEYAIYDVPVAVDDTPEEVSDG